jgi:autotransporter-associated beta strand protein
MKTLILAAIRCSLMLLVPSVTYAISAQWDLDPISGDWNTADNWTPMTVPNGSADVATFGLSNTTNVSISEDTEVNGITFTPAATNPYNITVNLGRTLTLSGNAITNNSGITQRFVLDAPNFEGTQMRFTNSASAGNASIDMFEGGSMNFFNRSTAGNARILLDHINNSINFFNRSTAGSATIDSQGRSNSVNFFNASTAGSADFNFDLGIRDSITFHDNSTAGSADVGAAEQGSVEFFDHSSAGNATVGVGFFGSIGFFDSSTAPNATIAGGGADIFFGGSSKAGTSTIGVFAGPSEFGDIPSSLHFGSSSSADNATLGAQGADIFFSGSSKGGTAAIGLFFHSGGFPFDIQTSLNISFHSAPGVTIGSIAGNEGTLVFLGANNLTVGSNNLSTTFSGVIQDGDGFGGGGTGGSLTKIGSGTLILSGANTYTGNTNVNRGVLQVDGSITSNTSVNHGGTLAGTGTINGNVMSNGKVSPGDSPGVLTVVNNYTQAQYAALMIQIAGTNTGQFSVLNVLGNANLNGFLDPVLLNGFVPIIGDSFTFLNYASLTGEFARILHPVFNNGTQQWSVTYEANHAILTVEQHVPDQGSTFLLLALGLLGFVTFRQQLLRGQT